MSSESLRAPFLPAFVLALASIGAVSCGQQGKVTSASTGTPTGGDGGSGGSGGAGASGGGGTAGGGGTVAPQPLRLCNWNLHNMFDTEDDPNFTEDFALTSTEYNEKLAQLGALLTELSPDIAVLPEVENQAILDDLNMNHLGGAYTTAITETNDFRGLDIGILSKLPIVDLVSHKDDSFKRLDLVGGPSYLYSRDAVEVHLNYNGRPIVVLGVHYRSKGNGMVETDDKDKRMAEAQHTRAIADALAEADPKRAIVILGDFNDLPGSPPVSWTLQGDPMNDPKIPFSSAASALPEADQYTFVYNGTQELIDWQMANPLLTPMLDAGTVLIRHGADVEPVSDHFPLCATYQIQ
jgi:endonuclease/exonuclease/phosphatase family metal-dependent hydrolase